MDNRRDDAPDDLKTAIYRHLRYSLAREDDRGTRQERYLALALAVRDRLIDRMLETERRYEEAGAKRLYYLSMEFLVGRSLGNNLINLGLMEQCEEALKEMGADLEELRECEPDAALGNGGLGRLAACFLDSLATLDMAGYGYGINYEYGLFRQEIKNGWQKEQPDNWLAWGTPWELERPEERCVVLAYGRVQPGVDAQGRFDPGWRDWLPLIGVPHDMPIVGYGSRTVNVLRLFSARAWQEFDIGEFNDGDYHQAVSKQIDTERISKILYPSDIAAAGKELRLLQEYFLVACAIQDVLRRYGRNRDLNAPGAFSDFPNQVALQLNDTHPALAVAELMRTLMDDHQQSWEAAWEVTTATLGYTNHTLMAEALEKWPVPLFNYVLPRHLQIVYEINQRFLDQVAAKWPGDGGRRTRMSIIEEANPPLVRMAHLAIIGSHSVNGVSALHSELIKTSLVPDFYQFWPEKFNNKTNGITPRRWLLKSNPPLANLITEAIGDAWVTDLDRLHALEPLADDVSFRRKFWDAKQANKTALAGYIQETLGIAVDPASLFDVQIKRIHEYKRQLLFVLFIVHEYLALVEDGRAPSTPRTCIIAGKAPPGYWAAKQIIKLINNVAEVINADPRAQGMLTLVFVPDYKVSVAEKIIPAADLSEQISTAGKEASGTSNMKLALNGALTMGTLDGANIEIRDEVGADNLFIFGLTADQIHDMQFRGTYHPWDYCGDLGIRRTLEALRSDRFCPHEPGLFRWVWDELVTSGDPYFHLADLPSYLAAQAAAGQAYQNPQEWARKAILNVARMGKFSSDRTIAEYARDIWHIRRV
jgi:starch phosphorylase